MLLPGMMTMCDPLYSNAIFNTLRPRQNGQHCADDIFKCILLNENVWISIDVSLKFDGKGPMNNIPALAQIVTWCQPGDKPLSEPMMISLLTHIFVTQAQWVNTQSAWDSVRSLRPSGAHLLTWMNLIVAWIRNHVPSKVWDEVTYPFQLGMDKIISSRLYCTYGYLSMLRLKSREFIRNSGITLD